MLGSKISPEKRWTDIDILQITEPSIIMSVNSCGIKDYEGWVPQSKVLCDLGLDYPLSLQSCTKILNLKLFARATMCKLCALRINNAMRGLRFEFEFSMMNILAKTQPDKQAIKCHHWWPSVTSFSYNFIAYEISLALIGIALLYFFNRMRFIFLLTQYYLPHSAASYQSHRW